MSGTEMHNRTNSDILTEMEMLRKKAQTVKMLSWASLVLLPIFLISLFIFDFIFIFGFGLFFIIAVGLMGLYVGFLMWHSYLLTKYKSYTGSFKSIVVKEGLEKVFMNPIYEPDSGWPVNVIRGLGLFKDFNIYATNDLIKAKYKNVSFEQADIELIDEHKETYVGHNGRIQTRTVRTLHFSGRMIKFNFDAAFPSDLRIVGRKFGGVTPSGWKSIETASVDFNKKFLSSAPNMPAALTILKPQLIIKMLDFYEWFGQPFAFYFKGNNLFVFLPGDKTFELLTDKDLESQRKIVLTDIGLLLRSLNVTVDIAKDFIDSSVMVKK